MRVVWKLIAVVSVVALSGCASQEAVDSPESVAGETEEQVAAAAAAATDSGMDTSANVLLSEGIAGFETGGGLPVSNSATIALTTGGARSGRLIPVSSDPTVKLYVTRDGSVPSAENNWGGPVDPAAPPLITRRLEGSGVYKVVAGKDGNYSGVVTVYVDWRHEENPALGAPSFEVDGRPVTGSAEIRVSDGSQMASRLYIVSDYAEATLYISRDGTTPTPETFWKSQTADGTYLYSPDPTAAAYRVIAVWQDAVSPVASLDVTWVE